MDFTTLRPTDDTAPAIAAALVRARTAREEVSARVGTAKASRDALLLNGTEQNLAKAETALAEARRDLERMEAIVPELEQQMVSAQETAAAAEQGAILKQQQALLTAANQAGEAHNAKWREVRGTLREAAAAMLAQRQAFNQAASDYENTHVGHVAPGMAYPRPDVKLDREVADVRGALEQLARLPG
jgi:multidrug resistance efflux pump